MAAKFIIGRAGTGKTQWCFDRVVESIRTQPLGDPIYWIVPRQATFAVQRRLACTSNLGGYFRARVLSFEELATEILAESGGIAIPEITDRGRRMILGHLLRQLAGQLQLFGSVAHQPGVAAALDGTFAEFDRAGHEPAVIQEQLRDASAKLNPALKAKIHDLSLIYSNYIAFLGQDRLDPSRRLADALGAIGRCRSLQNAEVFIDSFHDFTGSERLVIAALAKACKSVAITLTIDPQSPCIANPHHVPDEMSLFHRCETAYRKLWFKLHEEKIDVQEPVLLREPHRFHNTQLVSLERVFSPAPETSPQTEKKSPESIQLVETPDPRAEVDAAARWIRLQVNGSMRYRDIAVLMRSQHEYHDLIESSFREHGIPFFVDRRRTAAHHPLLRLIRAALAVAMTNWSHESMMAIIKTGMVGLNDQDADALENFVLLHGIHHTTWISPTPWTGRRTTTDESEEPSPAKSNSQNVDPLRRKLVDRLWPFVQTATASQKIPVRTLATAVFRLLQDFQCREKIVEWMDRATALGHLEERGEHERVWDELVKLFDELVDLFGNDSITLKDFSAILDSALEGFDLGLTPPTVDQVLIGDIDRTRTDAIKACIVLGMAEGQFPLAGYEDSVFTSADRRAMGKLNIDLDPDTSRRLLDENFLAYLVLTRAQDRVLLTRSLADTDGKPRAPSPIWQRIVDRFPDLKIHTIPREENLPDNRVATPRQLIGALMRWVRSGQPNPTWDSIYQWLASRPPADDAIDIARFRGWKALSYRNEAVLDPKTAAALFPSPLRVTAFELESFRKCPFQHFARHGLKLTQRRQRQVTGADLSQIYHEVLERLVRELIESKKTWPDLGESAINERIANLTAQRGRQLRDELMLSTARNRYLLDHVEKTLALIAAAQSAFAGSGDFKPGFTGVHFGDDANLPPLAIQTPGKNEVLIRGKIDRVDLLPDGSACAVDYRLSTGGLDASSAYHGLSLQLLTSLLALEQHGKHLTPDKKLTPSAAFCVQLLRKIRPDDPQFAPSPDDPAFHLRVKPRGIFHLDIAGKLDKTLTEGNSQVVQLFIKKDGGIGRAEYSDAASAEQFTALLRHVERRIAEIADEIIAGKIEIRPYRLGKKTPCPFCEFRALCRLEPSPGCYEKIEPISRPEMFERLTGREQ